MSDLSYPIGKFAAKPNLSQAEREELMASIELTAMQMKAAIAGLSEEQLETPYRPEGWTVRQTVHHTADSHLNMFVRYKLALTEDFPTIKPYDEKLWAELTDGRDADPNISLQLLDAVHRRWVILLRSLSDEEFARQLRHPEAGVLSLDEMLQLYEWHGRHHIAHITSLRQRKGW